MTNMPQHWVRHRLLACSEPLNGKELTIVTYNTLADCHVTPDLYPQCEGLYLYRNNIKSHRHRLLIEEIIWLDADVICLQEIDAWYFNNILQKELESLGYQGIFAQKTTPAEGLAIFYKTGKLKMIKMKKVVLSDLIDELFRATGRTEASGHYRTGHVLLMAALELLETGRTFAVGTIHTLWNEWKYPITTTLQIATTTQALDRFISSLSSTNPVPYVLCGDFNIEPQFPAYKLLEKGGLGPSDVTALRGFDYIVPYPGGTVPDQMCQYELDLLEHLQAHFYCPLKTMESAYKRVLGKEPAYTWYNLNTGTTLDYIWSPADTLRVVAALEIPPASTLIPPSGIPSDIYSSDHFSLKAYLRFVSP